MSVFYKSLLTSFGWAEDGALVASMAASNSAELVKLTDAVEDAQKNHGETEGTHASL